jgi:hypothetical protein
MDAWWTKLNCPHKEIINSNLAGKKEKTPKFLKSSFYILHDFLPLK